jgi:type I restriction enzyme S subunit
MNDVAPEGWTSVTLGLITESAVDGPFGSNLKTEHYVSEPGVRVVRLQNLGFGSFLDGDQVFISGSYARTLSRHSVVAGDLLIASLGDDAHPVARACQYPQDAGPAIVKADCFRFRLKEHIADHGFVRAILGCEATRLGLAGLTQGVTRDRINLGSLQRFSFNLPPITEQRKITEILDSIDESIKSLERSLYKRRMSRLGTTCDLLTFRSIDSRLVKSSSVDQEFSIKSGITLGPHRRPRHNPAKYLRVANVQRGRIDTADLATLEASRQDRKDYELEANDLLVIEGHASPMEIGRCARVLEGMTGLLFQNHLFRLRSHLLDPAFAELWLNSESCQEYWRRTCSSSSGLYTINARQLAALPVLVPPADVQQQVVRQVGALDEQISLNVRQLEKLSNLKRGLMEDLLTGRIRVNVA